MRDISDHKLIKSNYVIKAHSLDMQFNVKKNQWPEQPFGALVHPHHPMIINYLIPRFHD
jgi:hypothetical protein